MANSAKGAGNELELGRILQDDEAYTAQLFREARPFYVAADFPLPPGAKEE